MKCTDFFIPFIDVVPPPLGILFTISTDLTSKFEGFLSNASIFLGTLEQQGISHNSVLKATRAHRFYFLKDISKILKKSSIFS